MNDHVDPKFCTEYILRKSKVVRQLAQEELFGVKQPLILLLDLNQVDKSCRQLIDAFPKHFAHRFAIKANPTRKFLKIMLDNGIGLEAASIGELSQALAAGAPSSSVVFDCPVKPRIELEQAIDKQIPLNADNFQELAVITELINERQTGDESKFQPASIGMRVNPGVGAGSLAAFSTATLTSKFGVGLKDEESRAALVAAYQQHAWLDAIHCHVGSQGVDIALAIDGIRATVDFALDINRRVGRRQIRLIDIGGGLSVNFASDEVNPTFAMYAEQLRARVPELFDDTFDSVLTEFGRALCAKAGFFASRVEYTKTVGGRRIALQFAGADVAVRSVFMPTKWVLRCTVLDGTSCLPRGGDGVEHEAAAALEGGLGETDVAGPCCFQADIVAHRRMLPPVRPGDTVLLHDVGGYFHAQHSRYNLRQMPPLYGYRNAVDTTASSTDDAKFEIVQLQQGETIQQTIDAFC